MSTAAARLLGQIVEKVRILMGETGKNRALRMTDLLPNGEITKIVGRAGGSGTGSGPSTTDDLPEGANNLYFTGTRAAAAAPVKSVAGLRGDIKASGLAGALDLGTAAQADREDFATSGQGQLAESAVQDSVEMPPGKAFVRMERDWALLEVGDGLTLTPVEGDSENGGKVLLEVVSTGGAVPYYVPEDTVYVVPLHMQALFTVPIELAEGAIIELDGILAEVN